MVEKVGVYCRLSNEDRDKVNKLDDSESIVNQKSMCIKYAEEKGWTVVDIYSDDDFSGAGTYRPEFERLIKDCESGRINIVLCKSQSRFSRDLEVIERLLHCKFVEWGVRFVSIVDYADTFNIQNKKSRQINGLMNEWYLLDLSDNIKKSLKNKRDNGLFMGSFAPYGYDRDPEDKHKLIIDPVASDIVKTIFEMYASGLGYYKICEYLNNNNIPTRANYKKLKGSKFVCSNCDYDKVVWTPDTIAQILRNEAYIGNLVQGKITSMSYKVHKFKKVEKEEWSKVENTHEAIIDIDTWNKVQQRLGTHTAPTKDGNVHYLSKKVYCMECDKVFQRNVYHVACEESGKRAYLQCRGAKKLKTCKNNKAIRLDAVEKILVDAINDLLNDYYDKENLKNKYNNTIQNDTRIQNKIQNLEKEKNNLEKKIIDNRSYFRKLYEDKAKNVINEEMFRLMSNVYLKEIEEYTKRIENIDTEITELAKQKDNKVQVDTILKKYKHINKLNKVIVDEFIDKVYVGNYNKETKSRDIEIVWNFDF